MHLSEQLHEGKPQKSEQALRQLRRHWCNKRFKANLSGGTEKYKELAFKE